MNENEPQPVPEAPAPPEHLNEEARATWDWLVKTLDEMGLLASSDVAVMTLYCDTWAEYVKVRKDVERYGFVMISPKTDMPFLSPHVNLEAGLKNQLQRYLSELGLSPTSRTRVHATPKEKEPTGAARFFRTIG